jgi:dynein heavy chain, axonemal
LKSHYTVSLFEAHTEITFFYPSHLSPQAEQLIPVVKEQKGKANIVKDKVQKEETAVRAKAAEVKAVSDDAQRDLDKAMPALENALKALKGLDKKDIQEIK